MACQLRFSTSTVAFVNMFINLQTTTAPGRLGVCSLLKSARIKLAATAGNAPALPVSETGVQTSTLSGKMVAREGSAPSIAGCRPAVILFHHRAEKNWLPGLGKKVVEPEVVATSPNPIKSR